MHSNLPGVIPALLTQHTEELAVTWQRRQRAWAAPNHRAKAQLSEHYKKLCPNAQVKAKLQDGSPVAPTTVPTPIGDFGCA